MISTTWLYAFLTTSIASGLLGLAVMAIVITQLSHLVSLKVSPVVAIGSVFTHSHQVARSLGWIVHVLASICFSMLYTFFFMSITPISTLFYPLIGMAIGAAHGFVVFFLLIPTLAEHHWRVDVRAEGGQIGIIYIIAHIFYGITVGTFYYLSLG